MEKRLSELRQQLHRAENNDEAAEKEIEIIKRKALQESERRKWMALREVNCSIFISLITGKKIAVTYITLLNLLALPFVWILDHLGYNYDSFVRRTALV